MAMYTYSCSNPMGQLEIPLPCRHSCLVYSSLAAPPYKGLLMADIQPVQLCASQAPLDSLSCRSAACDTSAMCLPPTAFRLVWSCLAKHCIGTHL